MRILGLDIGDRRIGVAMSDPGEILASPLTILERESDTADIGRIIEIIAREGVGKVIAGLPRAMNGTVGVQAEKVLAFAEKLAQEITITLEYRDERLTTLYAGRLQRESLTKKKDRHKQKKTRDDAIAAAIILQGYLDEKPGFSG